MKRYLNTNYTLQVTDKNSILDEKSIKRGELLETDKNAEIYFDRFKEEHGTKKVCINKKYLKEIIKLMGDDRVMELEILGEELPIRVNTKNFTFVLAPIVMKGTIEETEDNLI